MISVAEIGIPNVCGFPLQSDIRQSRSSLGTRVKKGIQSMAWTVLITAISMDGRRFGHRVTEENWLRRGVSTPSLTTLKDEHLIEELSNVDAVLAGRCV